MKMDALKFIEERNRMCERYWQVDGDCDGCPLIDERECNELRNMVDDAGKAVGKAVEIVEQWSQEHPRKTRQDVFMAHYPDAALENGTLRVCPRNIYKSAELNCNNTTCYLCKRAFWMQEVE